MAKVSVYNSIFVNDPIYHHKEGRLPASKSASTEEIGMAADFAGLMVGFDDGGGVASASGVDAGVVAARCELVHVTVRSTNEAEAYGQQR